MSSPTVYPLTSLPPQLVDSLKDSENRRLQNIIGANITSRYASSTSDLADFRSAIADKDTKKDTSVLSNFRRLVPLTNYEAYRPWMDKFVERPCELSEVENLFAPGLPSFLGVSSATSSSKSKHFARYVGSDILARAVEDPLTGKTACLYTVGYKDSINVTTASGEVVKRLPVCIVSAGFRRHSEGWSIETDNSRMASMVPGNAAPWVAGLITHHRSFLLVHALFALADPTLTRISVTFVTLFTDWICYMQEEWDTLLSSIRDGIIPDIEHISHVRDYLQINMRADPQRANELTSIGPPLSFPAWAPRVWTNLNTLVCVCSGTFATALPVARSVIGPDIVIQSLGYGCTECILGKPLNLNDPITFVVDTEDVAEYLDIANIQTDENILQAWDLQPGKLYQPVVTTRDGLWRYMIDDVLHVTGFDPRNGEPVFRYYGRTNLAIQLPHAAIKEVDLVKVVQAISGEDILRVHEFTTIVDRRELPETVGFVLEVTDDIGPNANIARQKAFEVLVTTNGEHQCAFDAGRLRLPTIRIVKYGTFAGYRRWRGERMNVSAGQMKVPVVMVDPDSLNWLAEKIVREL